MGGWTLKNNVLSRRNLCGKDTPKHSHDWAKPVSTKTEDIEYLGGSSLVGRCFGVGGVLVCDCEVDVDVPQSARVPTGTVKHEPTLNENDVKMERSICDSAASSHVSALQWTAHRPSLCVSGCASHCTTGVEKAHFVVRF